MALALLVRGGAAAAMRSSLSADPDGYRRLAENVLQHGVFGSVRMPTAYRPPLYPLLLAAGGTPSAWKVALLHVACGAATVWLTVRLGSRSGLGRWSLVAGALVACDPILLNQSAQVMTETLATLLAVGGLVALAGMAQCSSPARPQPSGAGNLTRAALAGAIVGLAALCRPTFLTWLALVAAAICVQSFATAARWRAVAALLVGAAVALAPWMARNQLVVSRPIATTTHGGFTLFLANNGYYYDHLAAAPWGSVWDSRPFQQAEGLPAASPQAELHNDRAYYAAAWRTIRDRPAEFFRACFARVARLWGLVPRRLAASESVLRRTARYAVGGWYLVEFALGAAGFVCLRKQLLQSPWLWSLLLALAFTAVHAVYWTDLRMRAPLIPSVALLAAAGGRAAFRRRFS